jgi:hypothetical protein
MTKEAVNEIKIIREIRRSPDFINRGNTAACIYTLSNPKCTSDCKKAARPHWCCNNVVGNWRNDFSPFFSIW